VQKSPRPNTGADADHSPFNSLTQLNRSVPQSKKQGPRKSQKARALRRCKTPWQEKAQYQRDRCVKRLKPCQVAALHEADYHARCISLPLNLFLTVRWQHTIPGNNDYLRLFQAAWKRMDAFCHRRAFKPTWLYVHEAPDGKANTHFLIHVPERNQNAFTSQLNGWFEATDDAAIDVQPRHCRPGSDTRLIYMCKGTDAITASRIGGRAKRQGDIRFKRCGTTANIGPAARARFKAPVKAPSKPRKW
jgi:hypothetical protein